MGGDLRYALRALAARPGFTLIIVLTLGLGIGANAAIFSVVDALLLRPFPFRDPDRLVRIVSTRGSEEGPLSVPEHDDLLALDQVFADVALYTDQGLYNASGFGAPEELPATITTHNLFRVLGVAPIVGAPFDGGADRSRRFELVISHGLWTRRFGQDPNIVGRTMTLDGAPGYTIHGVLPPGINFPSNADLFRSSGISADPKFYERRDVRQRLALARLRDGVTVDQAQAEVNRLAARLAHEFPASNAGIGFRVTPIRDLYVGHVRAYLWLLFAAVALVLVIACANVASLLLSRGLARDRELALRLALGAGRARLFRLALAESGLLALLGGVVGFGVAFGGIRLVTALVPAQLPPWMRIQIDEMTLAFLAGAALVTGLAAGLVPAMAFGDVRLSDALREGGRGSAGGRRHQRTRSVLVVAEVALAMVLLAGASLMLQSVRGLMRVDPGFDPANLLTFRVELGWRAYDSRAWPASTPTSRSSTCAPWTSG
jgi:putative ABC transport system permease protein